MDVDLSALVVDDDESVGRQLGSALQKLGFKQCRYCEDADEALEVLEKGFRCDFIFADVHMPNNSAAVFLQILAQHRNAQVRLVPIVGMVGKANPAELQILSEIGVTLFLSKPFTEAKILAKVQEFRSELGKPDSVASTQMAFRRLICERKTSDALELVRKAVEANPRSGRLHMLLAEASFLAGNDADALREVSLILKALPDSTFAMGLAAKISIRQNKLMPALQLLEKAHRLCPLNPERLIVVGELLLATGRPGLAEARFRSALQLYPRSQIARAGVAKCLALQGMPDAALELAPRAGQREAMVSLLNRIGVQLVQDGRFTEAVTMYESAFRLLQDPVKRGAVCYNLALAWVKAGNLAKAGESCKRGLFVQPNHEKLLRLAKRLQDGDPELEKLAKSAPRLQAESPVGVAPLPVPLECVSEDLTKMILFGFLERT